MHIQKISILICFVLLFSTNSLFGMDRDAENAQTLIERWYGQEDKVIKAIAVANKTRTSQFLMLGDGALQATFVPFQKKVILFGAGFEKSELPFEDFVQQISPKEQIGRRSVVAGKKKRCVVQ